MRSALIVGLAVACSSPQSAPPPAPPAPAPTPAGPDAGGYAEPEPAPDPQPDPPAAGSQIIAEFEVIKNDMCACRDKTCAEQINKDFEAWLKRHARAKGSKAEQEQAKKIAEDYTRCMMAAMTGGPDQGQQCAPGDRCADGLTCIKYYGVAGAAGPELSSCEIPCGAGKPVCPTGQTCRIIADGPGQVCRN